MHTTMFAIGLCCRTRDCAAALGLSALLASSACEHRPAPPAGRSEPPPVSAKTAERPSAPPDASVHASSPFGPTVENDRTPPGPAPAGMVWIPGGEFSMGAGDLSSDSAGTCNDPMADAWPVHRVYVDGFWMDATEVTNEAFAKFVRATGYVTVAERTPTAEEFPDAPPEKL